MDGITEPVVIVLGHPIAGNPAQFALERAFESLDLGWRVLSCDVPPEHIHEAISGAEVLGFRGLLLDHNLVAERNHHDGVKETATAASDAPQDAADQQDAAESSASEPSSTGHPDLYWRLDKATDGWNTENVLAAWLESEIRGRAEATDGEIGPLLWIGAPDARFPSAIASEQNQSPIAWASAEAIEHANLIAISEKVDFSEWPRCENDSATLVVDFANPPNDVDQIRALGYEVLGREEARIGILLESIERWTGQKANAEVLIEAVEEYLAV